MSIEFTIFKKVKIIPNSQICYKSKNFRSQFSGTRFIKILVGKTDYFYRDLKILSKTFLSSK